LKTPFAGIERISEIGELASMVDSARERGERVVFVPTMGALHEGHLELIKKARELASTGDGGECVGLVIVSVFVNPAQFGEDEDFSSYPRTIENDAHMAEGVGADILFTPSAEVIYPEGFNDYIELEELSNKLCGASRPGHFRGVATVVARLFEFVHPDKAVFGEKDFQQLVVIRRMVEDLALGVEIIGVPTVRESSGLAMSSRNCYLNAEESSAATAIPRALKAASQASGEGEENSEKIVKLVRKIMEKEPLIVVDYIELADSETLEKVSIIDDNTRLFLAIRIGNTRLIDNHLLSVKF
jgi:pantoate--beta-alanine ligase